MSDYSNIKPDYPLDDCIDPYQEAKWHKKRGQLLEQELEKQEAELKKRDERIIELEKSLSNMVDVAQEVDNWECFPSRDIDNALEALNNE